MIYDIELNKRNDEIVKMGIYKGKVLLIVNTATGCGFTPQYEGLENLYKKYHNNGLEILDFPCDQFGHQAPGTDDEIHDFCISNYQTSLDQLKKTIVNGDNAHPLFKYLVDNSPEEITKGMKNKMAMKAIEKISSTYKKKNDIRWNFTKFLIDKEGNIVKRFAPTELPSDMEKDVINLLESN